MNKELFFRTVFSAFALGTITKEEACEILNDIDYDLNGSFHFFSAEAFLDRYFTWHDKMPQFVAEKDDGTHYDEMLEYFRKKKKGIPESWKEGEF